MTNLTVSATVFGNPIEQSKSPVIHSMFAKQFDIPLQYSKTQANAGEFTQAVSGFFTDQQAVGANVTMPFKDDALNWVDELSAVAQRAGAVNTIIRKGERFVGDNTDGYGLVSDLLAHNVVLKGTNVLLIGAGGAAKGALPALVDAEIAKVDIYNRSEGKASDLVTYTNSYKHNVARMYKHNNGPYSVIVNATSLSLQSQVPALEHNIFAQNPAVYDMVYLNEPTVFLKLAQQHECTTTIDGLGMLVHQAAKSFELWFGKTPNTQPVYDHLRALLLE
ncbi:MAG: shikimate dehydrogenase [Glaciecola sp.]